MFILLPFIAMKCVFLFFDEGMLLVLTSNSYFLLTFLFFTCFPPSQNPLHKPLPLRGLAQHALLGERLVQSSPRLFPREGSGGWAWGPQLGST